jgi:carboxymethylenebutenolidase
MNGGTTPLPRADGGTLPVAWLKPAQALSGQPALVLLQEWWGLNEAMRHTAQRLADVGYTVLLPDLYRGRVTTEPALASQWKAALDLEDVITQDLPACVHSLKQQAQPAGRIGVMGFCMGGALTVAAAARVAHVDAAVCFYGIPPLKLADPAHIRIPFMGHFALQDDWCTPQAARQLQAAMADAGQSPVIHTYDAQHGFFNHTRPEVYSAADADLAWQRSLAFLAHHLSP